MWTGATSPSDRWAVARTALYGACPSRLRVVRAGCPWCAVAAMVEMAWGALVHGSGLPLVGACMRMRVSGRGTLVHTSCRVAVAALGAAALRRTV